MNIKTERLCKKCGKIYPLTSKYFCYRIKEINLLEYTCKSCRTIERKIRKKLSGNK